METAILGRTVSGEEAGREQSVAAAVASARRTIGCAPALRAVGGEGEPCLGRLVLKDTVSFLTDASRVTGYGFPWITCRREEDRRRAPGWVSLLWVLPAG